MSPDSPHPRDRAQPSTTPARRLHSVPEDTPLLLTDLTHLHTSLLDEGMAA